METASLEWAEFVLLFSQVLVCCVTIALVAFIYYVLLHFNYFLQFLPSLVAMLLGFVTRALNVSITGVNALRAQSLSMTDVK